MNDADIRLDGRVVLVAGAGGDGIGTATAIRLAQAGAVVVAIDRSEQGCSTAEKALSPVGRQFEVVQCDLEDRAAVTALVERVSRDLGPIRGLVNVVGGIGGSHHFAPLLDSDAPEIFARIMNANLAATFNASTETARAMIGHGLGGSIVQIASLTGLVSMPYGAGYAAAKAALLNLTRTMAIEWGGAGIRVNAIAVGLIRTERSRDVVQETDEAARHAIPLRRVGEPDEIAAPIQFLLSDFAAYITGATLTVDGGSIVRASYNDAQNLPVFVNDPALRRRLFS